MGGAYYDPEYDSEIDYTRMRGFSLNPNVQIPAKARHDALVKLGTWHKYSNCDCIEIVKKQNKEKQ